MASSTELAAMHRAIELSAQGAGSTNPNPSVGAVVLDAGGLVVGEGMTRPAGGDHAEVVALAAAGERARGGTLVTSLEPCDHLGRTGPCTAAIVAAGVSRVVFAVTDPHRIAAGGAGRLRAQGVDVEADVLAEEAARPIERWLTAVRSGRPHVTWKYAATLDGRSAAADGSSRWITGGPARADGHRERAMADAVVVGIGTVLADDPQLAVRDWPADRQPMRVVVDGQARTPPTARVLDPVASTLVAVGPDAEDARVERLRTAGAEVARLPRGDGGLDLAELVAELYAREVRIVLLEGGATLAAGFLQAGLVDRVVGYHAPALLGAGAPVLGDVGVTTMAAAHRLELDEVGRVGTDVRVVARVCPGAGQGTE